MTPQTRTDTALDSDLAPRRSTGFLFPEATAKSLAFAVRRALAIFAEPRRWQALQRRGMRRDFSWQASARAYQRRYRALQQVKRRPPSSRRGSHQKGGPAFLCLQAILLGPTRSSWSKEVLPRWRCR